MIICIDIEARDARILAAGLYDNTYYQICIDIEARDARILAAGQGQHILGVCRGGKHANV